MSKLRAILAFLGALFCVPFAQAVPITFVADLSGPAEAPPNTSPGTGGVIVVFDADNDSLFINAVWSGLVNTGSPTPGTTVAHIHCCTAVPGAGAVGVAVTPGTLPGFPTGTLSGSYLRTIDLSLESSYTPAFLTATNTDPTTLEDTEAALLAGIQSGRAYFNIHSAAFPGGEIRGFLRIPEPASLTLLGLGLIGLGVSRRMRAA